MTLFRRKKGNRLGRDIAGFLDRGNSFLIRDEREDTYKQITESIPGLTLAGEARDSVIKIDDPSLISKLHIHMEGSNHCVHIGGFSQPGNIGHIVHVRISIATHHCTVDIGRGVGAQGGVLLQCDSPCASIVIGEEVWLAGQVALIASDTFPIVGKDACAAENSRENMPPLAIGDRCWVGTKATLLKGTVLPADTMVGAGSVVTGPFTEENTLISGNPAVVRARHISWARSWYNVS